ncbi:hypothetical protein ACO0K2_02920 [Undibacterium sp. MH2W]|uniref:hypothetical protein n=1 Tax=Undibacterium sp. MH2W TaxID=3413044 RepID=UPI003BF2DD56
MLDAIPDEVTACASLTPSDIELIHVIETLIIVLRKYEFSLCFVGKEENRSHATIAIANDISHRLHGTSQAAGRVESLFNHYVAAPHEVVKWEDVGRIPEVGSAMNEILKKTIDDVVVAANSGAISRDRAIGTVNGITSILFQTGAISLSLTQTINNEVKKRIKKKFFLFEKN